MRWCAIKHGTLYLFTSIDPKHTFPSDVILRHTTFTEPILPPSRPHNVSWFSSGTLALYKSLTYLLTYLKTLADMLLLWLCHQHKASCQQTFTTRNPLKQLWKLLLFTYQLSKCNNCCTLFPRCRLSKYSWRAFYHAGPTVWNSLPDELRKKFGQLWQF